MEVPSFIRPRKKQGFLYINKKVGQIDFLNMETDRWKMEIMISKEDLLKLTGNDFHLFLDDGK